MTQSTGKYRLFGRYGCVAIQANTALYQEPGVHYTQGPSIDSSRPLAAGRFLACKPSGSRSQTVGQEAGRLRKMAQGRRRTWTRQTVYEGHERRRMQTQKYAVRRTASDVAVTTLSGTDRRSRFASPLILAIPASDHGCIRDDSKRPKATTRDCPTDTISPPKATIRNCHSDR